MYIFFTMTQKKGQEDTTSIVTYTIMIWYTPQFLALFSSEADMNTFVDLVFTETNEGYINSNIPVSFTMENEKDQ